MILCLGDIRHLDRVAAFGSLSDRRLLDGNGRIMNLCKELLAEIVARDNIEGAACLAELEDPAAVRFR